MQPTAEQFTEKAWAAIVAAQQLAQNQRHQQLETEHLLLALLQQNGLANRFLEKAGVSPPELESAVEQHLQTLPALQNRPDSVYLGKGLNEHGWNENLFRINSICLMCDFKIERLRGHLLL